jgi:hypothetical protein
LVIRRALMLLVAGTVLAGAVAGPAAACRLALVLALDVSSSVDAEEDALQRRGLANALLAPEVQRAMFATDAPVALAVFEWSGRYNQELLLDWTLIDTPEKLAGVSRTLATSTRSYSEFPTAIGYALGYAAGLMTRAPACLFKTVDMAGDGENNEGFGPAAAYAEFPFEDVTVNGLVVDTAELGSDAALVAYYRDTVLHGPGAFLEIASGFADYERAMRRKLERELRPPSIGARPTSGQAQPG